MTTPNTKKLQEKEERRLKREKEIISRHMSNIQKKRWADMSPTQRETAAERLREIAHKGGYMKGVNAKKEEELKNNQEEKTGPTESNPKGPEDNAASNGGAGSLGV